MTKKRRRPINLHVMVSEEEQALIRERMAEAGIRNMGAYMRKMALNGYVLHVDLSPVRELVSLQRRCSNNLNQVAIQANTYGGRIIMQSSVHSCDKSNFSRRRSMIPDSIFERSRMSLISRSSNSLLDSMMRQYSAFSSGLSQSTINSENRDPYPG